VRRTSFEDVNCSIAQCLEVVGDWWTMLVVRDVFLGVTRFDDIQERLGISRNVLHQRLSALVDHGVLHKVPYQQHPERFDYRLTEKGRDLWLVLTAMRQWGDRWYPGPDGPPVEIEHRTGCGEHVQIEPVCGSCGERVGPRDLRVVPGPGSDGTTVPGRRSLSRA
jgi:DNA-binding HxlR family transcriptional regulator